MYKKNRQTRCSVSEFSEWIVSYEMSCLVFFFFSILYIYRENRGKQVKSLSELWGHLDSLLSDALKASVEIYIVERNFEQTYDALHIYLRRGSHSTISCNQFSFYVISNKKKKTKRRVKKFLQTTNAYRFSIIPENRCICISKI